MRGWSIDNEEINKRIKKLEELDTCIKILQENLKTQKVLIDDDLEKHPLNQISVDSADEYLQRGLQI